MTSRRIQSSRNLQQLSRRSEIVNKSPNNPSSTPYCCEPLCPEKAEWSIHEGGTDVHECENETHSCTAHLGEMLCIRGSPAGEGPVWFAVYPLDKNAFMPMPIAAAQKV